MGSGKARRKKRPETTVPYSLHLWKTIAAEVDEWREIHYRMYRPKKELTRAAAIRLLITAGIKATKIDWESLKAQENDPYRMRD